MKITVTDIQRQEKKNEKGEVEILVTTTPVEFETHPQELIGSAARRYARQQKKPEPPPNRLATFAVGDETERRKLDPRAKAGILKTGAGIYLSSIMATELYAVGV